MFLIVEGRHAEWDQAAAKPQTKDAAQKTNQPSESTFLFSNRGHSSFSAVLACALNWVLWPYCRSRCGLIHYDNSWLLGWCHLVLNRLSIWSILDGLALWVWLGLRINWLRWGHLLLVSRGHGLLLWLTHKGRIISCILHLAEF